MKKTFTVILLLISAFCVEAGSLKDKIYGNVVVSDITSVYDADTFRVNIKGFPEIIGHRVPIRVNNIDSPEIKGSCPQEKKLAREAKQFTVGMLRSGRVVELRNMKRGKYFRIVADVFVDGQSLGEHLVVKGLAVRYDGGKKTKDWCK